MRTSLLFIFLVVLAALVGASIALADESDPAAAIIPSASETEEAAASPARIEPEPTDSEAAEELPHKELDREEAGELLEGVFEPEVDGAAGIYSDLHVKKFLGPYVAVIAAGQQPEVADGSESGGALESGVSSGATLMDSTEPLATEGESGQLEAVDLSLEGAEGSLAPANPLLEVAIPAELGEGIELSGPDIGIEPEGVAESRGASTLGGSVAFYPNIAEETDLAVAPTLGGVETLTQMRSPGSPRLETYRLMLPAGASLAKMGAGAIVTRGEETLMTVTPPTALDAEGASVPTELSVEGDHLTIKVSPGPSADYPILVDPLFQSYEWYARHTGYEYAGGEGWEEDLNGEVVAGSYGQAMWKWVTEANMSAFVPTGSYGLIAETDTVAPAGPGQNLFWIYHVPRYKSDPAIRGGAEPETFISHMTTSDVAWRAESNGLSPYMVMGLWGPSKGWASLYTHEGLSGHSINNLGYVYPFPNEQNVPDVKMALVGLSSTETVSNGDAELFVGATTVELSEPQNSAPQFAKLSGPTQWANRGPVSLSFEAKDAGLGVHVVRASTEGSNLSWSSTKQCTGVSGSPCPFAWESTVTVEPEKLPTGIDKLNLTAEDPLGHVSAVGSHVELGVDHTPPEISLSGSATEQATLGTERGSYTVRVHAVDGTPGAPQSGVARATIKVDGHILGEVAPGCATENCTLDHEWTLQADELGPGGHSVEVVATDAVGLSTSRSVEMYISQDVTSPTLELAGSLAEEAAVSASRPQYGLSVRASDVGFKAPETSVFAFGSHGTGPGQFNTVGALALDPSGGVWAIDYGGHRLEHFARSGEFLGTAGGYGSGAGELIIPDALAVDAEGDLWVADSGWSRIEEFGPAGGYLGQFPCPVPSAIAVTRSGTLLVGEASPRRISEYSRSGVRLKTFAATGSGPGQIASTNDGIAVGPDGNVWISDYSGDRVDEFSEGGGFIRSFGSKGTGPDQFKGPGAIAVDAAGDVWVTDSGNDRVEVFDEEGDYAAQFGAEGTGEGQFKLSTWTGIAADAQGRVWVSDSEGNRVERWHRYEAVAQSGIQTVQLWMDGEQVNPAETSCMIEECTVSLNWTLQSKSYDPGTHQIAVRATDRAGNSTTKHLAIDLEPDTTGPSVEVGGELANAPEGWVQQETYGVHASATDGGYGVISLVFKIDGDTVASETAACPEGGCGLSLAAQANMADYSGGAHKAEVVATDGAGNRNVKSWTINVDPEGRITTQEETETLEAVEATSDQTPVAPSSAVLPAEQREGGDDPGLSVSGSEITSTGVPDVTRMTTDPEDGFTIQSPEGTTTITPVISETSSTVGVVNGVAGVAANVGTEADQVIRPEYNGVQIAQEIRSEESPETFTWRVHLAPRQELIQVNPTQAEVVYTDGTESFLITAEPAHDATGKPVPTSLSVSGDELTVKVEFHNGSFVYPIVAGEGWETSYTVPVIVEGPEDETQIREREERERREAEELAAAGEGNEGGPASTPPKPMTEEEARSAVEANMTSGGETIAPPLPTCKGTCATASDIRTFVVESRHDCSSLGCGVWNITLAAGDEAERPHFLRGYSYSEWDEGSTYLHCSRYYSPEWAAVALLNVEEKACNYVGPWKVSKKEDKHLTVYMRAHVSQPFGTDLYQGVEQNWVALQDWVWPNGDQKRIVKHYDPGITEI